MKESKELREFETLELFAELSRRGYCKNPIIDLEFIKSVFKEFEVNHNLDIEINEIDLITLSDNILKEEKVMRAIESELIYGFKEKITNLIQMGLASPPPNHPIP